MRLLHRHPAGSALGYPIARRWLVSLPDGSRRAFRSPEAYAAWVTQARRHHELTVLAIIQGGAGA